MNDLVKFCRYYKGEEECPYKDPNERALWFYERAWTFDAAKEAGELAEEIIISYITRGLASFEYDDGVPLSLKAYLFNCLGKWGGSTEGFKEIYRKYYTNRS